MRWRVAFLVVFGLVSGLSWTAVAVARGAVAPEPEDQFVARIGDERSAAGLGGLTVSQELVDVARRHAQEMADRGQPYHNDRLATDVSNWQKVGENVGVGPSVEEIHRAFMGSSAHRDNILDPDFTEVGVGVVADGPDLWVVEVFRLPKAAPAPAAQQPAPTSQPAPPPSEQQASSPPPSSPSARSGSGGSGSGGAGVRAASATSPPPSGPTAASTAPEPPTTLPSEVATTTTEAPLAEISASVAALGRSAATPATTAAPTTVPVRHGAPNLAAVQPPHPRDVTLPVGLAAALLVVVVGGLVWQVASERARLAAGARRPSVVDVWELALAA